jgi:lipopolysaccharide export LptBFGC system permease protein LptF
MLGYLEGVLQIANVFLAIVAGIIAISLFHAFHRTEHLKPWKILVVLLVLFAIEESLGGLVAFGIIGPTFLTHLIPTAMLLLLIYALDMHIKEHTSKRES